jgi:hypothetical protein
VSVDDVDFAEVDRKLFDGAVRFSCPLMITGHLVGTRDSTNGGDFMFLLDGYPFLLVEVYSGTQNRDCDRMIAQLECGVFQEQSYFVAVADYITKPCRRETRTQKAQ